jgi:hypothetical protein
MNTENLSSVELGLVLASFFSATLIIVGIVAFGMPVIL